MIPACNIISLPSRFAGYPTLRFGRLGAQGRGAAAGYRRVHTVCRRPGATVKSLVCHELLPSSSSSSVAPRNKRQLAAALDIPAPNPKATRKAATATREPKPMNKEVANHKAAAIHSLVLSPHEHPLRPARLPPPQQSHRGRLDRPDARRPLPTGRRRRHRSVFQSREQRGFFPSRPVADRSRRRPGTLHAGQAALADSSLRGATCAPPASRSSRSVSAARWRRALLWRYSCVRPLPRDRLPRRRHPALHSLQRPRRRRRRRRRPCRRERTWRAWRVGRSRCS